MKKTALIFSVFTAIAMFSYCQDTTRSRSYLSVPLGVGIGDGTLPILGTIHLHDTRPVEPLLPPSPDMVRDSPYDYITTIRMTNLFTGASANDGFYITQHNGEVTIRQLESGNISILGYNGAGIIINTSGRIGIGSAPNNAYRLNIGGNTRISADLVVGNAITAGSAAIGNGFTCSSDGQVRTKGIRVTLDGWSDFVFDDSYLLPSLKEVEQYIARHRHLPDIPSAAEVEQQGVDLGQMNALLLQKVEELTLYIIDLQKQINELKKQHN